MVAAYELEPPQLRILQLLGEALDRADRAQKILDKDDVVVVDRFGQRKAHPAVGIKRDAEVVAARMVRELALEDEAMPDPRLPRPR